MTHVRTIRAATLAVAGVVLVAEASGAEKFPEEGRLVVGVNYWGSKAGVRMWRAENWDEASIEKDVAALAESGVEMMRVFPTWDAFQPLEQEKKFAGIPGMYMKEGGDRPVYDPLWLDEDAMARFGKFCDIAERHKVRLEVSLITGWMSGRLFVPRMVERLNLVTDPEAIMWEGRFARAFVRRMKHHPAIVAWDLGNECNCMGKVESSAQAWNWLNTISSAVRMEDPSRPVVSGMHAQTSNGHGRIRQDDSCWNLQMQGELLDVLTPHPYPAPWRVDANRGPFNSFRNALHPVSQCLFYSGVSGKPSFVQEVGSFGPTVAPDRVAAKGMRQQMFVCWQHGVGAYLWWCAFEQMGLGYPPFSLNAMERELGILRADGGRTPKPQAGAIRDFRAFRDRLPFDRLPPCRTDAVCLVSEREEFYHQAFGALMLAKEAGFDLEFAPAESRDIPDVDFYILPSGTAWETWAQETWEALIERVRRGATLLVSRGGNAGYSRWTECTGLEQTLYRRARTVAFEFEGRKMSVRDDFTAEQKPVDCEVAAADSTGSAVVAAKKLGEGQVIAVNIALEKCTVTSAENAVDGDFSNELWRIYAFAARSAGVKRLVEKDDPRVILTEHPPAREGRSPLRPQAGETPVSPVLVVAVNTRDTPVECPVRIDGTVGRVWNCKYEREQGMGNGERGTLSIRENDGCVFEVHRQKSDAIAPAEGMMSSDGLARP